jgi:hypothetical protein
MQVRHAAAIAVSDDAMEPREVTVTLSRLFWTLVAHMQPFHDALATVKAAR